MNEGTNINDIPSESTHGGDNTNVVQSAPQNMDVARIAEIVKNLNHSRDVTLFPDKHVPPSIVGMTTDPAIMPNYIPPSYQTNYISADPTLPYRQPSLGWPEYIFDHIQLPLLLALLYFLFQVPSFIAMIQKTFPTLINEERNYTFVGKVIISALFGTVAQTVLLYMQYMKT